MKKIIILALICLITKLSAQDTQKKLTLDKGYTIARYGFTTGGALYILTNKKMLSAKARDASFYKYNAETLDLDYSYKPTKNFNILETSPKGEKVLFNDSKTISLAKNNLNILNENGEVKEYEGDQWIPKDFIVITRFISKDYYVALGHQKGQKKSKNHLYQMFSRNLNTFESTMVTFELPKIPNVEESKEFEFQIVDHTNDSFSILTKNFKDYTKKISPQTQEYILAEYNYQGELIKTQTLITKIDDSNLSYRTANTGPDSYDEVVSTYSKSDGSFGTHMSYVPNPISRGNIYIDLINKTYYTYSIIGSKKSKYGSGFLINKFDFTGKLLWTQKEIIATKKEKFEITGHRTYVKFLHTNSYIGFAISNFKDNYAYIFKINPQNGEIILQKNFKKMKAYQLGGFGNFDTLYSNEFVSDFTFKENFPKSLVLDVETLTAYILNEKFKTYIDNLKNTKNKLNIISSINKNTVTTIQADNKNDDFKLLIFKW